MKTSKLSRWLQDWPQVRAEVKALIETRAKREPDFYRVNSEQHVEEVDRALAQLDKLARRMVPKAD